MNWDDYLGHDQQRRWFATALAQDRLATSFLFVGPDGVGKSTFAILLAKSLLCRSTEPDTLTFCNSCEDCAQVDAATHPDLLQVSKPEDRAFIPVKLLIGEPEKRMREGLCHDISLRPFGGRRKIAILNDADALNVEGANCLLKTLEEPPTDSLLILIGTSLQRQLPTIRSRCQAILFQPLAENDLAELIVSNGIADSTDQAAQLAMESHGNLADARMLADPGLRESQSDLLNMLVGPTVPVLDVAKHCAGSVDEVGKDARARRDRLKVLLGTAAAFYREVALHVQTVELGNDVGQLRSEGMVASAAREAVPRWQRGAPAATACWNRCLEAMEQTDRNANQSALLESWTMDLMRLSGF